MTASEAKEQYQQMRNALSSWVTLGDDQWKQLAGIFQSRTIDRREHILLPCTAVEVSLSRIKRSLKQESTI